MVESAEKRNAREGETGRPLTIVTKNSSLELHAHKRKAKIRNQATCE